MSATLVLGALLLGFGGSPHCAVMCGAPCVGLTRGGARCAVGFHIGRIVGYMAAGALAAASVSAIGATREAWPALRPLWALLHVAILALGLWLLATGRQPEWRLGRAPALRATADGWVAMRGPGGSSAAGLAWVAWPCGLLHSALVLAALADGPLGGAAVMGTFSLASLPALAAAPVVLRRLTRTRAKAQAVRIAGLLRAGTSAWALGHGVWERVLAWCAT
jgi:sulfite exporter TauE/SafE